MDVITDGDVHPDFLTSGDKLLIPIIFSHAYGPGRTFFSVHGRHMASWGNIMFMINHEDGTANYAEKANGTGIIFPWNVHPYDKVE
mmetsp:Transcript_38928/g.37252  ORF Transcript_38928/g.37252 Transcript_38928/m.37252 type:complete len:86 (-) Transcript_38928:703-960(-)